MARPSKQSIAMKKAWMNRRAKMAQVEEKPSGIGQAMPRPDAPRMLDRKRLPHQLDMMIQSMRTMTDAMYNSCTSHLKIMYLLERDYDQR